jgi:hypothetical protein
MIRVVIACESMEQLETLLLASRAIGLTPDLGVGPSEELPRRSPRRKGKRSTSGKGKQKYPAKMLVKVGDKSGLTSAQMKAHSKLERAFGSAPFEKRRIKKVLRLNGGSFVTAMMDRGGLIAA